MGMEAGRAVERGVEAQKKKGMKSVEGRRGCEVKEGTSVKKYTGTRTIEASVCEKLKFEIGREIRQER